jgi:hypothetical protein
MVLTLAIDRTCSGGEDQRGSDPILLSVDISAGCDHLD